MLREKRYTLSKAAKLMGTDRKTLKRQLAEFLGIITPRLKRGFRIVVLESDLEKLLEKRRDARALVAKK